MAKKVGTLSSIFNLKSQIARYILQGFFEDKFGAGSQSTSTKDLQEMFKWKVPEGRSTIMIQKLDDGRLNVNLGVFREMSPTAKVKISGAISTKEQFVLDYNTFDIVNSEY